MIFGTWKSYFISWKFSGTKFDALLAKKEEGTFTLLSLAYPIDRLDWALFSVEILFHHWFPLLEKVEIQAFILPRKIPAVLIIFTGRVGAGNPPFPTVRGGAGTPPSPRGRTSIPGILSSRLTVKSWILTSGKNLSCPNPKEQQFFSQDTIPKIVVCN